MTWKVTAAVAKRVSQKGLRVIAVSFDPWRYETSEFIKRFNVENKRRNQQPTAQPGK